MLIVGIAGGTGSGKTTAVINFSSSRVVLVEGILILTDHGLRNMLEHLTKSKSK